MKHPHPLAASLRSLAVVVAVVAATAPARTVKFLADWYSMGNIDTIVRIDSVFIPKYDGTSGYVLGGGNQKLVQTTDFAAPIPVNVGYRNDTLPDSLKIPTQVERWWYSLPDFDLGKYQSGRIRVFLNYAAQKHFSLLNGRPPHVQVNDLPRGMGQTDQLETVFVDSCLQAIRSETVWIWTGALEAAQITSNANARSLRCEDHDPFLVSRGRVRLYVPQAGAVVQVRSGGRAEAMVPTGSVGWFEATIYDKPGTPTTNTVTFSVETSRGESFLVDSSGNPFHIADTAATHWIVPATSGIAASHATSAPTDSVTIAWSTPWPRQIPYATLGGGERITGAWQVQGWYVAKLPYRPAQAWLVSGTGSDSTAHVAIPSSGQDTIWLAPRQGVPDSVRIAGIAFDYALTSGAGSNGYFPFTQATNTGLLLGLFYPHLGDDGYPVWTGKSICGVYLAGNPACTDPANSPSLWFRPQTGKNAEIPLSLTLKASPGNQLRYVDSLYFPLDTVRELSAGVANPFNNLVAGLSSSHNYGYCLVFRGDAQLVPGAVMEFSSDDDNWVFVDGRLAVDLGGQHQRLSRTVSLDVFDPSHPTPLPPVVRLDVFHCERHMLESGLGLVTNFPIFPSGWIQVPGRVPTGLQAAKPSGKAGLRQIGKGLQVDVPAGCPWVLDIRSLDGRILSRQTGTGASMVPLSQAGSAMASFRSEGTTIHRRILSVR